MLVSSRMFRERPIVPAARRKERSTRNAGQLCPGTSDPDAPSTLILNLPDFLSLCVLRFPEQVKCNFLLPGWQETSRTLRRQKDRCAAGGLLAGGLPCHLSIRNLSLRKKRGKRKSRPPDARIRRGMLRRGIGGRR